MQHLIIIVFLIVLILIVLWMIFRQSRNVIEESDTAPRDDVEETLQGQPGVGSFNTKKQISNDPSAVAVNISKLLPRAQQALNMTDKDKQAQIMILLKMKQLKPSFSTLIDAVLVSLGTNHRDLKLYFATIPRGTESVPPDVAIRILLRNWSTSPYVMETANTAKLYPVV